MNWLNQNGLALYGAITGTAALLISFFAYRHNVKKDRIKLAVSYTAHPKQAENVERLATTNPEAPSDRPWVAEIFLVTVRNLGSIPAPLDDVGVYDKEQNQHQALVTRRVSHMSLLESVSKSAIEPLEPRAARTFSVYLKREQTMFVAVSAYAVDQTGKVWRAPA